MAFKERSLKGYNLKGHLLDGRTAGRKVVSVDVGPRSLILRGEDGSRLEEWPLDSVRAAEAVYRDQPVRLRRGGDDGATLTFEDPHALAVLARVLPGIRIRRGGTARSGMLILGAVLALGVLTVGVIFGIPRLANPIARQIPLSWEAALGERVAASLPLNYCSGARGLKALTGLAQRLQGVARPPIEIQVRIADSALVNAVALPGGRIIIFHGLLQKAQSADEVAGVLAHELAHVTLRHAMTGMIRAAGISLVIDALVGNLAPGTETLTRLGKSLVLVSHTRDAESEADALAVELLQAAGLASDGLITFLRRMQTEGGPSTKVPAFLSSHPLHEARIEAMEPWVRPGAPALLPEQWEELRQVCA